MRYVDVVFGVTGSAIPADHGFALFSAISAVVPSVHGDDTVGIHPINGVFNGDRRLTLTPRSHLTIRVPVERVRDVLPLAGKTLELAGAPIAVGVPSTHALVPAARLYSRLVIIKGFTEPKPFLDALGRQLAELGVRAIPSLVSQEHVVQANRERRGGSHSPFLRRTIRIHDKNIVGFAVRVQDLTPEESIIVQEKGLGGRRRFGCGLFVPDRK